MIITPVGFARALKAAAVNGCLSNKEVATIQELLEDAAMGLGLLAEEDNSTGRKLLVRRSRLLGELAMAIEDEGCQENQDKGATTPVSKLMPFDSSDWSAFAGCTSERPEVAYMDGPNEDETVAIVLDGSTVQLMVGTAPDTYAHTAPTPAQARLLAERLCDCNSKVVVATAVALGMVLI